MPESLPTKNTCPAVKPEKRAYRIKEAVAVSGLSRSTLYKLIKDEKIHAIKIGGRRLIPAEPFHALLSGR